jgi:hypothetical protein
VPHALTALTRFPSDPGDVGIPKRCIQLRGKRSALVGQAYGGRNLGTFTR